MSQATNQIEQLFESITDYSLTTAELWKLKTVNKTAEIGSSIVVKIILMSVLGLFVLMLSIGIAYLFGDIFGKTAFGFFFVSFLYLVIAIVVYLIRFRWLQQPIRNSIINGILKD